MSKRQNVFSQANEEILAIETVHGRWTLKGSAGADLLVSGAHAKRFPSVGGDFRMASSQCLQTSH
jgi:hypothetical protein